MGSSSNSGAGAKVRMRIYRIRRDEKMRRQVYAILFFMVSMAVFLMMMGVGR